ncbi:nuclease-related domain-containing protein [Streptomyces sp. NPDC050439]|uniref:nuclease-related domain-containing protein n=1 Tax=unclassified Streptomyces TaxID=2593676 RepID=UPI00342ADAC7
MARLSSYGWRVLHGVPKANGGDIDHLLIGPGGVFSINTKNHDAASVWVGDMMARVDQGKPVRYAAEREVSSLGPVTGELTPEQAEKVYTIARHRQAWLRR